MSTDYDSMGVLHVKGINVDSASGLKLYSADNSKSLQLKCVSADMQNGNTELNFPVAGGSLLTSASNVDTAKLNGAQSLGQPSLANSDIFVFFDASDSNAPKGVTAANLQSFIGASGGVPEGTDAQFIVYSGTTADAVAMSGDATLASSGALTIANSAVTEAKINNGAVTASKIGSDAVVEAKIQNGAVVEAKLASNAVSSDKIASNAVVEAKIQDNAVTKAKIADAPNAYGTVQASKLVAVDSNKDVGDFRNVTAVEFKLGTEWKIKVDGGALVLQWNNAGTYQTKHTFNSS